VDVIPQADFIPSATGVHQLIYQVNAFNCTAFDTILVKVDSRPEPIISLDNPAITQFCRRDSVINIYGWPEQGYFNSPAIQASKLNPALLLSGDHILSYLSYNGVCLDSATIAIKILDVPVVDAGQMEDSLCEGGAAISLGGASPPGGIWTGKNLDGNVFNPINSGEYLLTYTLPAQEGISCSASDIRLVLVKDGPVMWQVSDTSLCGGQSIRWMVPPGKFSLRWQDGSSAPEQDIHAAGVYFFQARDQNCIWNSDTLHVSRIKPLPVFSLGGDRRDCFRENLVLRGPGGMVAYRWERDGELLSEDSVCYFSLPGEFHLTVTDSQLCSYTDKVLVMAENCPEVYIPEAFSPNGDGMNEVWKIFGLNIGELSVDVFNAWGEVVFSGRGKESQWDGTFRDLPCPAGAYQFVLQYSGFSAAKGRFNERLSGQVILVR
jgi:gliding motility-associated-like protein